MREISPGIYISNHSLVAFKPSVLKNQNLTPTQISVLKEQVDVEGVGKYEIASWGENNDAPQKVINLIRKIGVAGKVVQVAAAAHFGTGLTLFQEDEEGKPKKVPYRSFPKIRDFDKRNNFNLYYAEAIQDLEIHEMNFSEFIVSNNFQEITRIKRQQAPHCRFVIMDEKTGRIKWVALHATWQDVKPEDVQFVRCFSQYDYFEDIQEICKKEKINKFIIPYHYIKNEELYYNKPFWQAPLHNGWAEIILSVPEVKNLIANQQLQVKYLIHISEEYFERAFGVDSQGVSNWKNFTADEQKKKQTELKQAIDDHLAGKQASGRSMYAPKFLAADGSFVKSIEIETIDDKMREGAFLPDASAGNAEIAFAKGVDPSIIGVGIPGSSNLSGSGSDKREAYTILCANMVMNRTISLLAFYLIRDWNKWGDDLDAAFPNVILTTLDKETSGRTEVIN